MVQGGLCLCLAVLMLAGAWSLPFLYESTSILYKFGMDKVLLRSGKVMGLTVGVLLFFQLTAVSHLAFLERIFSRTPLLHFHQNNGLGLTLLILIHPLLIRGADNFASYHLEKKYWPEFIGAALFLLLILFVLSARFRARLPLKYQTWLRVHRLGAVIILGLFFIHLLFVSDTFHGGLPRSLALALGGAETFLLIKIFSRALFGSNK